MDSTVDILIPIDAQAASALDHPARLRAAGRVLSNILTRDSARDMLAEAIAEAKPEARGRGITDADVEEELAGSPRRLIGVPDASTPVSASLKPHSPPADRH